MNRSEELWALVTPDVDEEVRRTAAALGVSVSAFVRSGIYRQLRAARERLGPEDLRRQARIDRARQEVVIEELDPAEVVAD